LFSIPAELLLQHHEVLVRLELGVGLGDGEQPAQGSGHHVGGLGGLVDRLRRGHGGARLADVVEDLLLVGRVALDRLDQVGDQVGAALELHVDLAPGVLVAVLERDDAVVDVDAPQDQGSQDDENDDRGHGATTSGVSLARHPARCAP
jgi:hypothetical protein